MAERIGETAVQKRREFCAFFIGEAGVFPVGLWIFQVDLPMRDIQIAAEDDRLFFFESFQIGKKIIKFPNTDPIVLIFSTNIVANAVKSEIKITKIFELYAAR